jgi:hypothetical protein
MAKSRPTKARRTSNNCASQVPRTAGVTEHDIARRAYDLYLARGGAHGHDQDDWLRAERELQARSTGA